jgi:hypothetical protein
LVKKPHKKPKQFDTNGNSKNLVWWIMRTISGPYNANGSERWKKGVWCLKVKSISILLKCWVYWNIDYWYLTPLLLILFLSWWAVLLLEETLVLRENHISQPQVTDGANQIKFVGFICLLVIHNIMCLFMAGRRWLAAVESLYSLIKPLLCSILKDFVASTLLVYLKMWPLMWF